MDADGWYRRFNGDDAGSKEISHGGKYSVQQREKRAIHGRRISYGSVHAIGCQGFTAGNHQIDISMHGDLRHEDADPARGVFGEGRGNSDLAI